MTPGNINLIKAQTEVSPEILFLEKKLRTASYIGTGAFLILSMIFAGIYFFLSTRVSALKNEEARLTTGITKSLVKEELYLSFKDRATLVSKIVREQTPLGMVFESIRRVAPAPLLSAFSMDAKNTVSASVTVNTVEDLMAVVTRVVSETKNQRIKNPVLEGISIDRSGLLKMTVSYIAVAKP